MLADNLVNNDVGAISAARKVDEVKFRNDCD